MYGKLSRNNWRNWSGYTQMWDIICMMTLYKILIVPAISQRDARLFNFNCQNVYRVGAGSEGQTVGRIWQKVAVVRTCDSIVSVVGSSEHGILSELLRSINLYV